MRPKGAKCAGPGVMPGATLSPLSASLSERSELSVRRMRDARPVRSTIIAPAQSAAVAAES